MAVSYISAITVMSYPADTYLYGLVICWYGFTTFVPTIIACLYFIPLYHRLQVVTIYQVCNKTLAKLLSITKFVTNPIHAK